MKVLLYVLFALLAGWMLGCSSVAVQHDFDNGYDFTDVQTYDWIEVKRPARASELKLRRFIDAMDTALEEKGYRRAPGSPDFLIAIHLLTERKIDVTDYGYSVSRRWPTRDVDVRSYKQGTVIVDFIDAGTKEMFWRGTASGIMADRTTEQQEALAKEAATKLVKEFPPGQ